MKKIFALNHKIWMIATLSSVIMMVSCSEDPVDPPTASFEISETNGLSVTFTSTSVNATSYSWDFGDNSGTSTESNPTYTYAKGGIYSVFLTVSNEGGTDSSTDEVTIAAQNQILNGEFDDDSNWIIISHNQSENGVLTVANGVATWNEAIDVPSGSWGNEAHMGMYQAVTIVEGNYQFDLDITTNGIDEVWFEMWVGPNAPIEGFDYNDDSGATKVLSFNTWDCADTNSTYSGPMAVASCQNVDGSITLDAGTYYVVIRSGGFTFGEGGIIADNVTMF